VSVDVATAAAQADVDLILVRPGGQHWQGQPLQVRVLGVLKRKQRRQSKLYDEAMGACPGRAWTEADAARMMMDAWAEIAPNVLRRSRVDAPAVGQRASDRSWSVPSWPVKGRGGLFSEALPPLRWLSWWARTPATPPWCSVCRGARASP
jgi:hypothetical protein